MSFNTMLVGRCGILPSNVGRVSEKEPIGRLVETPDGYGPQACVLMRRYGSDETGVDHMSQSILSSLAPRSSLAGPSFPCTSGKPRKVM